MTDDIEGEPWWVRYWLYAVFKNDDDLKKNEMVPSAVTWMDLEIVIPSEVSQRKTNIIWYHLYVESGKNGANEPISKTESQMQKTNMVTKGEGGEREIGRSWLTHTYYYI